MLQSADLKPGDLMFYESAKCYHQRSVPMQGRHYASIFLHYRPVGWAMTREASRFAIPPFWRDGLERSNESPSERSTKAEGQAADARMRVTFELAPRNGRNGGAHQGVQLFWVSPAGDLVSQGRLDKPGETIPVTTYEGHAFEARALGPNGARAGSWTIRKEHHNNRILIGQVGNGHGSEL